MKPDRYGDDFHILHRVFIGITLANECIAKDNVCAKGLLTEYKNLIERAQNPETHPGLAEAAKTQAARVKRRLDRVNWRITQNCNWIRAMRDWDWRGNPPTKWDLIVCRNTGAPLIGP